MPWFEHEEISQERFDEILNEVSGKEFDFVFSHTTALSDMPKDAFCDFSDPYWNDFHTEKNLERIKNAISYGCWYAGHYHVERQYEKLHILYHNWERIV